MKKIALFASGSGTNVENIIHFFELKPDIEISCIFCNRPDAGVLNRAKRLNIKSIIFNRTQFYDTGEVMDHLINLNPDLIVLAGFLWILPSQMTNAFRNRIINIHPALLPKYGGKGMYGKKVHQAVINSGDTESGITIHHVNENYDEGNIIFQAHCPVDKNDTSESLAAKIHDLEYKHFPLIIEQMLRKQS